MSGVCPHCPFAFTEESETVQNYGCLPTPYDILKMKEDTGNNWACHENGDKICTGMVRHCSNKRLLIPTEKERFSKFDFKTGSLINEKGVHY